MRRAILQGMGKARGGGSGQGLSPALAGGRTRQGKAREGKGKARIDDVVKKISNKAVQRKPPSGGAGGESSGRARPPPPQTAVPACAPGSAAAAAGELPLLPSAPRPRESWRHAVYAPTGQGGADGGAAAKRKAHEMTADDDETVRLVVGMMTPSETESEEESACPQLLPAASPGEPWTSARFKKRKLERVRADHALYRRMDAAAEESAAERGLLIPSLLAQLKEDQVAGKQPLEDGSEFTCKAELMLKVAAYNELHHKRSTARNGSKNNGGGGGEISCRNTPADYVAACSGNGDCTFLLKASCVLPPVVHV